MQTQDWRTAKPGHQIDHRDSENILTWRVLVVLTVAIGCVWAMRAAGWLA